MRERKKIDQLFQEKLSYFETQPPEEVWENIKIKLEKKNKRKFLPLWWKLSGIASSVIMGLWISNTFLFDNSFNEMIQKEEVESIRNPILKNTPSSLQFKSKQIVGFKDSSKYEKRLIKHENQSVPFNKTDDVASISSNKEEINDKKVTNRNYVNPSRKIIIVNRSTIKTSKHAINLRNNDGVATKEVEKENVEKQNKQYDIENANALANKKEKTLNTSFVSKELTRLAVVDSTKIINPVLEQVKKPTVIALNQSNELEELLKEKGQKNKKEKLNRWQINTNVAPVYYNSLSDGSPLDPQFESNSKEYNTSLSFGMGINYALSKKIKLRTGLNTVAVNYDINDVSLNPTIAGGLNISLQGSPVKLGDIGIYETVNPTGVINQKMGYVELPLELSYQILNKRFGIELIGGMSTLFLTQNVISMKLNQENITIGSANNLNNVHYSGNLGLGLKYGIMKKLELKVEPVLKYQFDTFSSLNTNSKTYIFGLYSGIGFNF